MLEEVVVALIVPHPLRNWAALVEQVEAVLEETEPPRELELTEPQILVAVVVLVAIWPQHLIMVLQAALALSYSNTQ
jgi:hypothetical protein